MKLKTSSADTLLTVAEAVGPQFVMGQLHRKAAGHKNPKVQSEAVAWMGRAVTEFGPGAVDVKALLDWAKEYLGSANAGVRNAAIQMLAALYRWGLKCSRAGCLPKDGARACVAASCVRRAGAGCAVT